MKYLSSILLTLAATAVLTGCHSNGTEPATHHETASAALVQSREVDAPLLLHATGTLHAHESAQVSPQVPGRLVEVLVHEGDQVRAGQLLARLDDGAQRSAVEQAEAGYKAAEQAQSAAQSDASLATATLDRYKKLQADKSVSPQEMDEVARRAEGANARVESMRQQSEAARAQLSGAKTMLAYTQIRAPFNGVVTSRSADPGTFASPGMPILVVDHAGPLELQSNIDESVTSSLRTGMKIPVAVNGLTLTGTLSEIVPAADPASHTILVKIQIPAEKQLKAGMFGTAQISIGSHKAVFVPMSAVVERGSLPCVYVLDQGSIAQLRYITLGAKQDNLVEVLSGLAVGETVVDSPADRDLAGMRIAPTSEVRP